MAWNELANCFNCNKGIAMMLFIWQGQYGKHTPQSVILHISFSNVTDYRWCHQMETFSALLALCAGNSLVTSEFPSQRPVMRNFDVFFDLRLDRRLSKQLRCWWFERHHRVHYNVTVMYWKHFGENWHVITEPHWFFYSSFIAMWFSKVFSLKYETYTIDTYQCQK